ncbi:RcnB family protein [Aerolutibacter ruishenii]|uniref:Ni/Co efflux regulator RcnB n=1 Tax=Aerolutibacter ruishenii TaxID=686800 RepID=A0A562LRH1_9GAMM|nr:RcnB family protein [Lysobacter ruishenii]TWI10230.1 Ni/Co efflux regulator RcnB [Lysobacter ruishenii]
MKRTLGSILALSLLMSGVAAAAGHDDDRRGDRDRDRHGHYDRDRDGGRYGYYHRDRDDDRYERRRWDDRRGGYYRHDNGRHLGHYKHRDPHYVAYRRGEYIRPDYRGYYVRDYRDYGLYAPPRNHEWRRMDDRYVLVSIATGIISAVILNSL